MAKMIRKTILVPEGSRVEEWCKNQSRFSPAALRAIEMVIDKYGTGDLIESIVSRAGLDIEDSGEKVNVDEQNTDDTDIEKSAHEADNDLDKVLDNKIGRKLKLKSKSEDKKTETKGDSEDDKPDTKQKIDFDMFS